MRTVLVILTILFSFNAYANDVIRVDHLKRADIVAIQRGWSGSTSACIMWKMNTIKALSKKDQREWIYIENFDRNYAELKDTVENFIWRCEDNKLVTYNEEDGWSAESYDDLGF